VRFIKKKNMQQHEELLYIPKVHWMYTVKHLFQVLPLILALCIFWGITSSYSYSFSFCASAIFGIPFLAIRHILLAIIVICLLVFIWRILLYLNIEYGVTNKRLIIKKGIFCLTVSEIPIDRIESIFCIQGILGRIFHYGTVNISGIGGKTASFYMAYRPYALRRKIAEIIEKNKVITVVHGDLPKAPDENQMQEEAAEDPVYRYGNFVRVLHDK